MKFFNFLVKLESTFLDRSVWPGSELSDEDPVWCSGGGVAGHGSPPAFCRSLVSPDLPFPSAVLKHRAHQVRVHPLNKLYQSEQAAEVPVWVFCFLIISFFKASMNVGYQSCFCFSLRVNLDMGKMVFSWMIKKDSKIPGTVVRASTIPEQLGRISYLLTDKTGIITVSLPWIE